MIPPKFIGTHKAVLLNLIYDKEYEAFDDLTREVTQSLVHMTEISRVSFQ